MKSTISNSSLEVSVKRHGAELCSIRSVRSGIEYLWQADPAIWGSHAPNLFPIVGKLADDQYAFDGRLWQMKQHGFARRMDFTTAQEASDSFTFQLTSSPETMLQYPFGFVLAINYRLEGSSLSIRYDVQNRGRVIMPFSIGAHPGFSLNWGVGDRIEDFFLEFEKAETISTHLLGATHLLSAEVQRVLTNERMLPLRKDIFDRDALIFLDHKSRRVSLCSRKHRNRLTVEFPGFPHLGIWSKAAAPYVCIEPWFGHADPEGHDGLLVNKPGIIKLAPASVFTCTHRILVEE